MTLTREQIAAEVRAQMGRKKITGRDLSELLSEQLDLSISSLARRIAGDYDFTFAELVAVCNALDLPMTTFLDDRLTTPTNSE